MKDLDKASRGDASATVSTSGSPQPASPTADSLPSPDSQTTVAELRQVVRTFVDEREWQKFHNPKNLSMALAVEASELMEHFQWLTTDEAQSESQFDNLAVTEEIADIASFVLALANALEIDLSTAIQDKMVKNRKKYPVGTPNTARGRAYGAARQ